jgi:hypothetical protein
MRQNRVVSSPDFLIPLEAVFLDVARSRVSLDGKKLTEADWPIGSHAKWDAHDASSSDEDINGTTAAARIVASDFSLCPSVW